MPQVDRESVNLVSVRHGARGRLTRIFMRAAPVPVSIWMRSWPRAGGRRLLVEARAVLSSQAMALAISRRVVPRARSDLIIRSMDTLGSPFSILAIRD